MQYAQSTMPSQRSEIITAGYSSAYCSEIGFIIIILCYISVYDIYFKYLYVCTLYAICKVHRYLYEYVYIILGQNIVLSEMTFLTSRVYNLFHIFDKNLSQTKSLECCIGAKSRCVLFMLSQKKYSFGYQSDGTLYAYNLTNKALYFMYSQKIVQNDDCCINSSP